MPIPATRLSRRRAAWSAMALVLALLAATVLAAIPTQAEAYALKAPSGLKLSGSTTTTLTLTWRKVTRAERYRLQYSTSPTMTKARYKRATKTRSTLTGLKPGRTYYVKVRVIDSKGRNRSSYSKAVKVMTPREDGPTPVPTPTPPKGERLRVASYNVKCANCFSGLPNEGTWVQRRQAVVDTILGQHLDVVGLEEASQGRLKDADGNNLPLTQFEDLRDRLGGSWTLTNPNRYNCVRPTTPTNCVYKDQGASQDVRIMFDSSRIELLHQGSKKLPFVDAKDNARYVAWAQLRQRSTGNRFVFAATHLEAKKDKAGSTSYHDLRRRQTQVALAAVKEHNPEHLPVIFVGDLNSSRFPHDYSPTNAPYDVLVKGGLVDPLGGAFGTTRTAPGATVMKRTNTWLDSFNGFTRTADRHRRWINGSYIDYIFVSPTIAVDEWETVVRMDASGQLVGRIPSDHNLIRASVVLPRTS